MHIERVTEENKKNTTQPKGGSIFVEWELFYDIGGYDSSLFFGYAPEDKMFWSKLEVFSKIESCINPSIEMFHMNHKPTHLSNPLLDNMEKDYKYFLDLSIEEKKIFLNILKENF